MEKHPAAIGFSTLRGNKIRNRNLSNQSWIQSVCRIRDVTSTIPERIKSIEILHEGTINKKNLINYRSYLHHPLLRVRKQTYNRPDGIQVWKLIDIIWQTLHHMTLQNTQNQTITSAKSSRSHYTRKRIKDGNRSPPRLSPVFIVYTNEVYAIWQALLYFDHLKANSYFTIFSDLISSLQVTYRLLKVYMARWIC